MLAVYIKLAFALQAKGNGGIRPWFDREKAVRMPKTVYGKDPKGEIVEII
jgi:hypothetical protein